MSTTAKQFHDHLDVCDRCRNRPMDLCEDGKRLLFNVGGPVTEVDDNDVAIRATVNELLGFKQVCDTSTKDEVRALSELISVRIQFLLERKVTALLATDEQISKFWFEQGEQTETAH